MESSKKQQPTPYLVYILLAIVFILIVIAIAAFISTSPNRTVIAAGAIGLAVILYVVAIAYYAIQ